MDKEEKKQIDKARRDLPGAALDAGDKDRETPALEKQATRILNNNPRNSDGPKE